MRRAIVLVAATIVSIYFSPAELFAQQNAPSTRRSRPPPSSRRGAPAPVSPVEASVAVAPVINVPPLDAKTLNAIVIIEGDAGRGSGFVAKVRDQYFVVTNLHVLSGQTRFTVTGVDGTKYHPTGEFFGARDYDVALLKIPEPEQFLELLEDTHVNTQGDDAVTVPGNSAGAGVVTQSNGKLVGIGPQLVEVDAKFVQGNSGSPIIHRPSGKVIGIATYAVVYKLDALKKAADLRSVRWFGYRMDNIKTWDKLDWAKFSAEGKKIAAIEQMTDALVAVLTGEKLDANSSPIIRDAYERCIANAQRAMSQNNSREVAGAIQTFAGQLQAFSTSDLKSISTIGLYPYHAKVYEEQMKVRAEIASAMKDVTKDLYANPGFIH